MPTIEVIISTTACPFETTTEFRLVKISSGETTGTAAGTSAGAAVITLAVTIDTKSSLQVRWLAAEGSGLSFYWKLVLCGDGATAARGPVMRVVTCRGFEINLFTVL